MQVCTSLQTDNHASTPPLSFLQAGCPSCRPTNSVKALKVVMHNPHKLNIDSHRNTKNIKIIKIAVEKCQFMREKYAKCTLCAEICEKMRQNANYAAIVYLRKCTSH